MSSNTTEQQQSVNGAIRAIVCKMNTNLVEALMDGYGFVFCQIRNSLDQAVLRRELHSHSSVVKHERLRLQIGALES